MCFVVTYSDRQFCEFQNSQAYCHNTLSGFTIFTYLFIYNTVAFFESGTHGTGYVPDYQVLWTVKQYLYWPKFLG
jgi:hypothetical protein